MPVTLRPPRPSRLLAVVRYEARSHMSGRHSLRLLGVAAALLLPAGLVPTPKLRLQDVPATATPAATTEDSVFGPPPPPRVGVRGQIPAALAPRLQSAEDSPFEIRGENPVVVVAPYVPDDLRSALDTLDGPVTVEYRTVNFRLRAPGRSLLIAILAISLLTGPLADALPGERARRTLEVLLTAGITRGELIGGKWLAWTLSATATAAISAGLACWRGVQAPGWWLAGLPLFVGSAVAFGLWLVRLVDDVVGGSAAPMRVLPVAAGTMAAIAWVVGRVSPLAGAAVPLGGPLMVAADLFPGPAPALSALLGSAVFVVGTLAVTARDLDRVDTSSSPTRWGALGLSGVATLLWWLTVAGAGVWSAGPDGVASSLVQPIAHTMRIGGIALLACAAIAMARESATRQPLAAAGWPSRGLLATIAGVAVLLAAGGGLPSLDAVAPRPALATMLERLREAAAPTVLDAGLSGLTAVAVSLSGQALLFRGVLASRLGWIAASFLWAVAVSPWAPWAALPASLALGAIASRGGWLAALLAHGLWVAAAPVLGQGRGPAAALALQAMALAISVVRLSPLRGEPSRHQS